MVYKKYGMGWFNESRRHSLARHGVKTGRKRVNYANDVSISPTTVSVSGIPSKLQEQQIMPDVDQIVAESREEREVSPEETPLFSQPIDEEVTTPSVFADEKSELHKQIEEDLDVLEDDHEGGVLRPSWQEKLKDKIKDYTRKGIQAIRDKNIEGIESHVGSLEEERQTLNDRIGLLDTLKVKIMSKEYRDEVGVAGQLDHVKRVNNLLGEPQLHMRKVDSTISSLDRRKKTLIERQLHPEIYRAERDKTRIFPTLGEIFNPLGTMQREEKEHKKKSIPKTDGVKIFPSFNELLNPLGEIEKEKIRRSR